MSRVISNSAFCTFQLVGERKVLCGKCHSNLCSICPGLFGLCTSLNIHYHCFGAFCDRLAFNPGIKSKR